MLLCLVMGAAIGAWLLVVDSLLVALVDGTWSSLSTAPVLAWALGAAAGGLGALILGRGGARRMTPRLVLLALAAIALIQVNHRWLPDALEPRSLLVTALIVVAMAALARVVGEALGRAVSRLIRDSLGRAAAWLAAAALVAVAVVSTSRRPPAAVEIWSARAQPLPIEDAGGAGGRRLMLIGIDGGRWETIDPLLAAGRMPHLAALVARGRRGVLASSVQSASPVVWTTIMTGQPPEVHGISDWEVAISTNRRVLPLWGILSAQGVACFVENVPGSFPADRLAAGMLAGFPMPQGSRSNRGWLATTTGPIDPLGPVAVELEESGEGAHRCSLVDLPSPFALEKTTPYLLLRRFNEPLALELARRSCGRSYGDLELRTVETEGAPGLELRSAGSTLCRLAAGEWSPWLAVDAEGQRCLLRAHAARIGGGELSVFFTALFRDDAPGLSWPPGLAGALQTTGRPYVAEGTGWRVFYEPSALRSLEEHQEQLGADRSAIAESLLARAPWDAFVHIFTLTDRTQHPFWKFREPELFARIPELYPQYAQPEPYRVHAPSAAEVREFGGAIDRAYQSVDRWLGRLVAHAADSTLIVVVSDHGGQAGPHLLSPTAGIHHEDGIYLLAGPTVPPRGTADPPLGPPLEQVDVVPLVLAHLGLPGAYDLPGVVPDALLPTGAEGVAIPLPEPVESYQADAAERSSGGEIDDAIRDQLRSLGYVK